MTSEMLSDYSKTDPNWAHESISGVGRILGDALQTQPNNSHLDHALAYIGMGWSLVMMKSGTKGPTHVGWNAPGELVNTAERATSLLSQGERNMGLVHQPSGTVAIDIDDEAWARHVFEEFGIDMDLLLSKGPRILSKSGRAKVLFRAPADLKLVKVQWPKQGAVKATELFTIFELRSGLNQDVLPPSLHPDGHLYQWTAGQAPWDYAEIPEMPAELLEFWRALENSDGKLRDEIKDLCPWLPKWAKRKIPSANRVASAEHNDIIGAYNNSTSVESLLTNAGYRCRGKRWLAPSSSTKLPGVVIFNDQAVQKVYSHHASDPLGDGHAHDAFDLLCTLSYNGDFNGALSEASQVTGVDRVKAPDLGVAIDFEAVMQRKVAAHDELVAPVVKAIAPTGSQDEPAAEPVSDYVEYAFPHELLSPPGVLGEMVRWMMACAQKPQPVLALAASLSLCSTVLAQKVESETGLRTNNYIVAVGDTSAGKDHGRKCIKLAMQSVNLTTMLGGEEIASGQGMLGRVGECPTTLFQLDEFGLLLKSLNSKNAASHQTSIITNLMKLFSSSATVYTGSEKADRAHKRVDIEYPCVNVHATTTPGPLFEAFGSADISSGNLNRLLILFTPTNQRFKMSFTKAVPPPEPVQDWIRAARLMKQGQFKGLAPATPITVPMSPKAQKLFENLHEFQQDQQEAKREVGLDHLWGRLWEHASKVAVVVACASISNATQLTEMAEQGQLVVDEASARWAIDFVKHVVAKTEVEVASRVADSDFKRVANDVKRKVEEAGIKGLTHRELTRKCHSFDALEPVKQDSVTAALKRSEDIFMVPYAPPTGRGKARMAWVSVVYESVIRPTTNVEPAFDVNPTLIGD